MKIVKCMALIVAFSAVALASTGAGAQNAESTNARVPEEKEVEGTARANAEMAAFAARQVAENEAAQRQEAKDRAAYEAALAERERIVRENEAGAAERERIIQENQARYEAEMADWRRRVAACEAGKKEFCAQESK